MTFREKRKEELGPLIAECRVSGRYLKFNEYSSKFADGEYITIDVMAMPQDEENKKSHKLCELILTREDLLLALDNIKSADNE